MTNEKPILYTTENVQSILDDRKFHTRRVIKPQPENTKAAGKPVKKVADYFTGAPEEGLAYYWRENGTWNSTDPFKCPYGQPGDELWVRETWRPIGWRCDDAWWKIQYKTGHEVTIHDQLYPPENPKDRDLHIRLADELLEKGAPELDREEGGWSTDIIKEYLAWKPSIHMPRGASRIQLKINDVRVERVQDISEADAQKEGWDMSNMEITDRYDPVSMDTAKRWFADLWDRINADRGYSWESNPWVWVIDFKAKEIKQ